MEVVVSSSKPLKLLDAVAQLDAIIADLPASAKPPSVRSTAAAVLRLEQLAAKLGEVAAGFDPVLRPAATFDPGDPQTAARMIALTLVAQQRYPLERVPDFYGSGVYAIYYRSGTKPFQPYAPLAGTDHPIYVGKADPDDPSAKSARYQGKAISGRLREHAGRIKRVSDSLSIEDFDCRFLGVQSGFQSAAETYLINFFMPIWNSDTGICFGMSKHGDSAATRGNGRSPWFTMHPGVRWADDPALADQKSKPEIEADIQRHFQARPPFLDIHAIFDSVVTSLKQLPLPVAAEPVPAEPD
jgi:hypothetical protein